MQISWQAEQGLCRLHFSALSAHEHEATAFHRDSVKNELKLPPRGFIEFSDPGGGLLWVLRKPLPAARSSGGACAQVFPSSHGFPETPVQPARGVDLSLSQRSDLPGITAASVHRGGGTVSLSPGLQAQVVWSHGGRPGGAVGAKGTNLPAAFLSIVERSLHAWPMACPRLNENPGNPVGSWVGRFRFSGKPIILVKFFFTKDIFLTRCYGAHKNQLQVCSPLSPIQPASWFDCCGWVWILGLPSGPGLALGRSGHRWSRACCQRSLKRVCVLLWT